MGVTKFVRVRLVDLGVPWVSLGLFGFVQESVFCRWCRSGSRCSVGCAVSVAGFVRVRVVRMDAP